MENSPRGRPKPEQQRKYGLVQVYPDPGDLEATDRVTIDIVAIYGLGARSPETWIAWKTDGVPDSGDVFWLKDTEMLPSVIPGARILTYDSNTNYVGQPANIRFLGHADTLLDHLDLNRKNLGRGRHPIVFIASCFGGLLPAKAVVRACEVWHAKGEEFRNILHMTVGIAFLGTPFIGNWENGHKNAKIRLKYTQSGGGDGSEELVQYLRSDHRSDDEGRPSPLNELVERFTGIVHHVSYKFPIACLYETSHTEYDSLHKRLPVAV